MAQSAEGAGPAPGFAKHPDHRIEVEPAAEPIRVEFDGKTVAESRHALILHESRHAPVAYFPREDVRMDLLDETAHSTHCPFKGDASYFSVRGAGESGENVAWSYEHPFEEMQDIAGFVAFYRARMSGWHEG
jgi:uncharacterized protein (DUF427 family)